MPGGHGGSSGGISRGSSRVGSGGFRSSSPSRFSRSSSGYLPSASGQRLSSQRPSSGQRPSGQRPSGQRPSGQRPSSGQRLSSQRPSSSQRLSSQRPGGNVIRPGKDGKRDRDHDGGGKGPWYKNIYNYYYGDGGLDGYYPYLYGLPFAAYAWDYPWYDAYDYSVRDVYPGDIYYGGETDNNVEVENKLDKVLNYVKEENKKMNVIDSPFIAISIILIIILLVGIIVKIR